MSAPRNIIYIMREDAVPPRLKIGVTGNLGRRLADLRRHRKALTLIASFGGTEKMERQIHKLCALWRIRGEWFADCPEVMAILDDVIACRRLRGTDRQKMKMG